MLLHALCFNKGTQKRNRAKRVLAGNLGGDWVTSLRGSFRGLFWSGGAVVVVVVVVVAVILLYCRSRSYRRSRR